MALPIRKTYKKLAKSMGQVVKDFFQKTGNPLNMATLAVFGGFYRESTLNSCTERLNTH